MEDDRHVRGVEQLNRIVFSVSSLLLVVDGYVYLETLEKVYHHKDEYSSDDIVQVRQSFSQESLFECNELVGFVP